MAGGGSGGGGSITLARSLQSEPAMRSENQRSANKHFGKPGTGTDGEKGSTSVQLQNSFASAFWTSHEFYFT